MKQLISINPATGNKIREYQAHSPAQVNNLIGKVQEGFRDWSQTALETRSAALRSLALALQARKEELAILMVTEMGKPIVQARVEIEKCAHCLDYYATHGPSFLNDIQVETEARSSFVSFRPLGVILAVMPWNFPFWQLFRFLAPALMAGNTAILKHSGNVCGSALAIEELFAQAGLPANLFKAVLVPSSRVDELIENPFVQGVSLTGSTAAGQHVAQKAGSLVKKTVLELGGSDAYLVLEDADIEKAAHICAESRLINSGQSCIAAKRFIVHESVLARFTESFKEAMSRKKLADPMDEASEIGPLARADLRESLHKQVQKSLEKGATLLLGGEFDPSVPGNWYPATILGNVRTGSPAWEEELFGPVASVISASSEKDAIRIAGDTSFGLGAAIFSQDLERATSLARNLVDAGSVFINAAVKSDTRLPFGGVKSSGYGRELGSFGIREFVNVKTVYVT